MCKTCKNGKCSHAGKTNPFMDGKKNVCTNFDDGKPRDYQDEWLDFMSRKIKITW